ncbi:MAG: hypothetical protein VW455_11385 [Nitrospinota bacterium]
MNGINEMMEFFSQKVFLISFGQIGLMFLLCFFCLISGRYKTGLLFSYFFIFYWGFVSNRGHWISLFGDHGTGMVLYLFSATAVALMGVISIFQENH